MNTVRSFWLGWGSVCLAGAGAYYFAKKDINADRQAKLEAYRRKRQDIREMESGLIDPNQPRSSQTTSSGSGPVRTDNAGSPSEEAGGDPAPTRHEPETDSQRITEKSKYETSAPFRGRRGDRFS